METHACRAQEARISVVIPNLGSEHAIYKLDDMAKGSQELTKLYALRKGDGTPIDVVVAPSTSDDAAVRFGMNLNDAPVPVRRFMADVGSVIAVRGELKLIFGQEKVGTDALRSMLVIQMSQLGARQFVQSFTGLTPSLDDIAATMQTSSEELSEGLVEPDQAVSFAANFAASAIVGDECCLDFYHASPFALRSLQIVKKVSVEPVVRVDLRLSLLIALLNRMHELEQTMKPIPQGAQDARL